MRRRALLLVSVLALFAATACGGGASDAEIASPSASGAPTASAVGGGQIDFNSIEGTDTVLWFWAPW